MKCDQYRSMLSEVHKLLLLYLIFTVPITPSTSERAFSSLWRLLTYLRATMTEQRLNNCMLVHIHKDLTDDSQRFYSGKRGKEQILWQFNSKVAVFACAYARLFSILPPQSYRLSAIPGIHISQYIKMYWH